MLSSHLFRLSKDPTSLTVTPLLYGMNDPAAPPPRISIEYEGDGVEQLVGLHKHDIDECSSAPSRSSKDSSLEGIASDAFTLLLQRAVPSATGAATLASIDTTDSTQQTPGTAVARARSQSDSVTVSSSPSTWHSTPPSLSSSSSSSCLPPQPRSFSSSCRRSAPIPAFILPCTPTPTKQPRQTLSDSNSDNLNVFNTPSAALTAPATPLTALSIEELTPGLAQLRRAFPLPPALRSKDETVDNLTTPTLESRMTEPQQQEVDLFAVSHRLPGAFESFDSLDTVHHHVGDSVARASAGHPNASMYESPRTPTEQSSQHRRSSSYRSTSSFKPSPESISTTSPPSMQKKRSKRALRSKRSKASFRSVDTGEDKELVLDNAYDPSSGYDFRSCPASPSSGQQQQQQQIQRPPHPPRSTSRGSWRSRYSRPETAMSVLTTTETVYEDAVDHFSGDEADAEEDANDLPPKSSLISRLAISTSSSGSSISTIKADDKPLGKFRLSFQRRRGTSPLQSPVGLGRSSSILSSHSGTSAFQPETKRKSGFAAQQQHILSPSTQCSSPEEDQHNTCMLFEKERDETTPRRSSSVPLVRGSPHLHQRQARTSSKGHTRNNSSSTSEDKERSASAMSALRPLMLTPEKTKRGSLKDWSILVPHASHFIEDFEHPSIQDHNEITIPSSLQSSGLHQDEGQRARENPYAEIYRELAKSPDIESDSGSRPPSLPETSKDALPGISTLKPLNTLDPVAEESFIESDKELASATNSALASLENESSPSSEAEEVKPNNSTISISVVAITTDSPQPLSAGRHSTESKNKRTSRPSSISTSVDTRIRSSSIVSSAISRPNTATSAATSNTTKTFDPLQNATLEYGQRISRQVGQTSRMETKSAISEGGFDHGLIAFFHNEMLDNIAGEKNGGAEVIDGLLSGRRARHSQEATNSRIIGSQSNRQRTRSHPAKFHHAAATSPDYSLFNKNEERYNDLVKELLPLNASMRKQVKSANRKVIKKNSAPPDSKEDKPNFSSFLSNALKKRKSMTGLVKIEDVMHENRPPIPLVSIKDLPISAPSQAKHICTGALNSHVDRDSPFGRRLNSPVRGYINVPLTSGDPTYHTEKISHPLFLDFDIQSTLSMASPIEQISSSSQRSSPSDTNISETFTSPTFFSSPLSSTSSHSEEGPSTPRALSPSTNDKVDFWAVSFAEAQAGEGDFVAPHATLIKGNNNNKLAMLSTNEKARRRASKASLKS